MNTKLTIIVAAFALIAGVLLSQFLSQKNTPLKPPGIQGAIFPVAKTIDNFTLTNQMGNQVNLDLFRHNWSLVFVGYTHCPDICPTTMAVMSEVTGYMKEENIEPPQIIFLSIDPERDTAELLKDYVTYFNPDFTGLTGQKTEIDRLTRQLNAVYQKAPGLSGKITDDDYLMDHSSALMLMNPDAKLQSVLTAPHTPGTIIESILASQAYYEVANE